MIQTNTHMNQIAISGNGIQLSNNMKGSINNLASKLFKKFLNHIINVQIVISKVRDQYSSHVIVHQDAGNKFSVQSEQNSSDPYQSFHDAFGRINAQLNRHFEKLKKLTRRRSRHFKSETKEVLLNEAEATEQDESTTIAPSSSIIVDHKTPLTKCSLNEAAQLLESSKEDFLVFKNSNSGKLNLVYHREDGNIIWVDLDKHTNATHP